MAGDDIISTLPDQVLFHILSFLLTQNAAATCILSKRWTPLWLSVPSLYFDDQTYLKNNNKPYDCFNKFIYKTILTRDVHLPIRMFRLECGASNFELSDSDLNTWINAATQRGVENLCIKLPIARTTTLRSTGVFSCKTLVVLKLTGLDVNVFSFVDLPSLKTLHLREVGFPQPQYLMELLSGCPILEDMYVKKIGYVDPSTPSNKKFKILSKLVKAQIYKIGLDIPLKAICDVQFLLIDKYRDHVPVFPNLTGLYLIFGSDMSWHLVLAMLKRCPKLQNLLLFMRSRRGSHNVVWPFPCFVPECLSSQLKTCFIMNYKGVSELHFAKYIMQNSRVLLKMTIGALSSLKLEDKFQLLKELSSYPRSSPNCQLLFT